MEHEFIDEMLERLLVNERMPVYDAFEKVIKERAKIILDLGRIENAYQLFRKRHKDSNAQDNWFREYIHLSRPDDYVKCVRSFGWK